MPFDPLPDLDNANVGNAVFIYGSYFSQGNFRFLFCRKDVIASSRYTGRMGGERLLSCILAMGTRVSG